MWVPENARIVEVDCDWASGIQEYTVGFYPVVAYTQDGEPLYGDAQEAVVAEYDMPRIRAMYEEQWEFHHKEG